MNSWTASSRNSSRRSTSVPSCGDTPCAGSRITTTRIAICNGRRRCGESSATGAWAIALGGRALNAACAEAADQARSLGRQSLTIMEESGDIAGLSVASVNAAVIEVLLGDLSAALTWLDRALAIFPIPGGHRSLGWLHFLRAHVLRQLGNTDGAMRSWAAAEAMFQQLGALHGLAAVQRICKGGLSSFSA
jgi:tetratricopeptide (TPR) repeat protein